MFVEAIRTYLASLGIEGVESWTPDEIMQHVDAVFQEYMTDPETFRDMANDFWENVRLNMFTVTGVLIGAVPDYEEDRDEGEPMGRIFAVPKRKMPKSWEENPRKAAINAVIQSELAWERFTFGEESPPKYMAADCSQIELRMLAEPGVDWDASTTGRFPQDECKSNVPKK